MSQVSFGSRRKEAGDKTGGELNLTLIFYEYDPRSCNDVCNLGVCCLTTTKQVFYTAKSDIISSLMSI